MTKFVLLYTGSGEPDSEEQRDEVMAAWGAWYQEHGANIVDGGNPFSNRKNVNGAGTVSEDAAPPITGYTIISADSLEDAVKKVKNHPHLKYGGEVSVYETFEM